jgi:hypothetical protein
MIPYGRLSLAIISLLLCLCITLAKDGVFRPGVVQEDIVALGMTTFDNAIQDIANPLWLIEFHAPWYVNFYACICGRGDLASVVNVASELMVSSATRTIMFLGVELVSALRRRSSWWPMPHAVEWPSQPSIAPSR